jgi:hypothetical protein
VIKIQILKEYRVVWEIELYATSPRNAARQALEIHRDPESTATVFDVYQLKPMPKNILTANEPVHVDLGNYGKTKQVRKALRRLRTGGDYG